MCLVINNDCEFPDVGLDNPPEGVGCLRIHRSGSWDWMTIDEESGMLIAFSVVYEEGEPTIIDDVVGDAFPFSE